MTVFQRGSGFTARLFNDRVVAEEIADAQRRDS